MRETPSFLALVVFPKYSVSILGKGGLSSMFVLEQ